MFTISCPHVQSPFLVALSIPVRCLQLLSPSGPLVPPLQEEKQDIGGSQGRTGMAFLRLPPPCPQGLYEHTARFDPIKLWQWESLGWLDNVL
jgi:hypothetical protein